MGPAAPFRDLAAGRMRPDSQLYVPFLKIPNPRRQQPGIRTLSFSIVPRISSSSSVSASASASVSASTASSHCKRPTSRVDAFDDLRREHVGGRTPPIEDQLLLPWAVQEASQKRSRQ